MIVENRNVYTAYFKVGLNYFIEINSRYTNVTTIKKLKHLSCSYITGNNRVCITSRIALARYCN